MSKYKVGDRVRIVKERTWDMSSYGDMDEYLGTIMTITFSPPKDEGNGYQMKEDGGKYSWTIDMIEGLANDKVELHPDFKEWYEEIENYWISKGSAESFAIACVNKIGFDCGLTDARGHTVSGKYPKLTHEMQINKEKYTRAILDNNWTVRKELWIIVLEGVKYYYSDRDVTYLMKKEGDGGEYLSIDWSSEEYVRNNPEYHFTEEELEKLDVRLQAFAKPLHYKE